MNISGRLTANAKVSTTPTGKEVVNFSIAINDGYRGKDGQWVDTTAFIDCAYWRTAKVAPWLRKGLIVDLAGQISTRAWIDKSGNPQGGINFTIERIKPQWGTATESQTAQDSAEQRTGNTVQQGENSSTHKDAETDDLPF